MAVDEARLRWSIERRLQFIEFRLFWDGQVNRGDLVRYFGISVPQASTDLARYQEIAGGNLQYDKRARAYVATPAFRPVILEPSASRYLAQLRAIADGVLPTAETWLVQLPPFAVVPVVPRRL